MNDEKLFVLDEWKVVQLLHECRGLDPGFYHKTRQSEKQATQGRDENG